MKGRIVDPKAWFTEHSMEDLLGHDRLARTTLRFIDRMPHGAIVALHGSPGSGKRHLMLRCAWMVHNGAARVPQSIVDYAWYNPWLYQRHGNILTGLVASIARCGDDPGRNLALARETVVQLNRLHFDDARREVAGAGLSPGEPDPSLKIRRDLIRLVHAVRGKREGRLVVFIDDVDSLSPDNRLHLLDGLRVLMDPTIPVTAVVAVGREAALDAIRSRDGDIPEASARRSLDAVFDLSLTVPNLDIRRIGPVLRHHLAPYRTAVQAAFGAESVNRLITSATNQPLGTPRFLEKLAHRVGQLAVFAAETRQGQELTEAQWAWVIVSERWPAFRRQMIRGGEERWKGLHESLAHLARPGSSRSLPDSSWEVLQLIKDDPMLLEYLRLHADELARDIPGITWVDRLLLSSGL